MVLNREDQETHQDGVSPSPSSTPTSPSSPSSASSPAQQHHNHRKSQLHAHFAEKPTFVQMSNNTKKDAAVEVSSGGGGSGSSLSKMMKSSSSTTTTSSMSSSPASPTSLRRHLQQYSFASRPHRVSSSNTLSQLVITQQQQQHPSASSSSSSSSSPLPSPQHPHPLDKKNSLSILDPTGTLERNITEQTVNNKRVLVVDDDPITRNVIARLLEKMGYEPTKVEDGRRALDVLTRSGGDFMVLLVDVMMPDMDGYTLIRMFKQATKRDIPCIMMSAGSEDDDPEMLDRVFQCGAEDFLAKPIKEEILFQRLHKCVEYRNRRVRERVLASAIQEETRLKEDLNEQWAKNERELDEYRKQQQRIVDESIETPIALVVQTITDLMQEEEYSEDKTRMALLTVVKALSESDLYKPAFADLSLELTSPMHAAAANSDANSAATAGTAAGTASDSAAGGADGSAAGAVQRDTRSGSGGGQLDEVTREWLVTQFTKEDLLLSKQQQQLQQQHQQHMLLREDSESSAASGSSSQSGILNASSLANYVAHRRYSVANMGFPSPARSRRQSVLNAAAAALALPFDLSTYVPTAEDYNSIMSLDYDTFGYSVDTLKKHVMFMFRHFDLFNEFSFDPLKLWHLLGELTQVYRDNYYHNFRHACDVTQFVFMILLDDTIDALLDRFDKFAMLVGALCHDIDHPGVNNNFLINTEHELALRYNERSVLENHHASRCFSLLSKDKFNILEGLSAEGYREFRKTVVSVILATDMASHFSVISKFETRLSTGPLSGDNSEDRLLLMKMVMKCADINNITRPFRIAKMWANLCMNEFLGQGDRERTLGLTISPLMDRCTVNFPKSQKDFADFIAIPLFTHLANAFAHLSFVLNSALTNRSLWEEIFQDAQKQKQYTAELLAFSAANGSTNTTAAINVNISPLEESAKSGPSSESSPSDSSDSEPTTVEPLPHDI